MARFSEVERKTTWDMWEAGLDPGRVAGLDRASRVMRILSARHGGCLEWQVLNRELKKCGGAKFSDPSISYSRSEGQAEAHPDGGRQRAEKRLAAGPVIECPPTVHPGVWKTRITALLRRRIPRGRG